MVWALHKDNSWSWDCHWPLRSLITSTNAWNFRSKPLWTFALLFLRINSDIMESLIQQRLSEISSTPHHRRLWQMPHIFYPGAVAFNSKAKYQFIVLVWGTKRWSDQCGDDVSLEFHGTIISEPYQSTVEIRCTYYDKNINIFNFLGFCLRSLYPPHSKMRTPEKEV